MAIQNQRTGLPSKHFGHLGVYFLSTGPDPSGPIPGERIMIVIYNKDNEIIRRLEQVKGDCIDEGWTDYFDSPQCRPCVYEYYLVDTDSAGNKKVLATHTRPSDASAWLKANFPKWATQHGIPE